MKTLFSRLIAGVVSRLSTRKTSVTPCGRDTSFQKGGFRTSRLSDISSSPVSLVSSLCASPVKLSSCKHSSSSGIRNGSFVIRNGTGFTLVELMIVIAIIGVLAASLFPMMSGYMAKARDTAKISELRQLSLALGMYKTDKGTYQVPNTGSAGQGWINVKYPGRDTLYAALQQEGYITKDKPSGQIVSSTSELITVSGLLSGPCGTYSNQSISNGQMLYFNDSLNIFSLSTHLERPTEKDIANIQTTYNGTGSNGTCTKYGMNYGIEGSY